MAGVTEWERDGAMARALEHYARAAAAIDAIVQGSGPLVFREPAAVVKAGSPLGSAGNAAGVSRAAEVETNLYQEERGSEVGAGVSSTEEDSRPRATFGHVFRWERSEKHGDLAPALQGRKGAACHVWAFSLVRKPLEPHADLFVGKRPEPGTHSVGLVFEDGYQVVTSMWAIRKVAA